MEKRYLYDKNTSLCDLDITLRLICAKVFDLACDVSHNKLLKHYNQPVKEIDFFKVSPYAEAYFTLLKEYDSHENYKNDSQWGLTRLFKERKTNQNKLDEILEKIDRFLEDDLKDSEKEELTKLKESFKKMFAEYNNMYDKVMKLRNITEETVKFEDDRLKKTAKVFRSLKYKQVLRCCERCRFSALYKSSKEDKVELYCTQAYSLFLKDFKEDENTKYVESFHYKQPPIIETLAKESEVERTSICKKFKKPKSRNKLIKFFKDLAFKIKLKFDKRTLYDLFPTK